MITIDHDNQKLFSPLSFIQFSSQNANWFFSAPFHCYTAFINMLLPNTITGNFLSAWSFSSSIRFIVVERNQSYRLLWLHSPYLSFFSFSFHLFSLLLFSLVFLLSFLFFFFNLITYSLPLISIFSIFLVVLCTL